MNNKLTIIYFGENKDFSDRWLISFFKKYYKVFLIKPNENIVEKGFRKPVLIINRIYTSIADRYGENEIKNVIAKLKKWEKSEYSLINSSAGSVLDFDRMKQFLFFSRHNIPYIETFKLSRRLKRFNKKALVAKNNPSGRNKKLIIINDTRVLKNLFFTIKKTILQPLVQRKFCYRTEFIGDIHISFSQEIIIKNGSLTLGRHNKIIKTPLTGFFINSLKNTLWRIGVQVFSIEYFLNRKNCPLLVDFNLTSNYKKFLLDEKGEIIKKAWMGIIKNEIKKRNNFISRYNKL